MLLKNKKEFYSRHMLYASLFPSFVSALALALADIADAVVVGTKIGENGLAAIGIVTPVYMIYNILGYGLSVGGVVTHSRLVASGRDGEANRHFQLLLWTSVFCGLAMAALGLAFHRQFLFLLGLGEQDNALLELCEDYYLPLVAAAPLFIANFILYDLVRSDGDPNLASISFSIGCVFDLILNILLVLFLDRGVSGSIAATIIAQAVSLLIALLHFVKKKGILRLSKPQIGIGECLRDFETGAASSISYLFQFLFLALANNLLMRHGGGTLYVAVFDVVMNVSFVAYALFQGTGAAIQPLVSALYEEKDKPALLHTLKSGIRWGMACGAAVTILIGMFAKQVAELFGLHDPMSLATAVPAIQIFCTSVPLAGVMLILIAYYQSVDQEKLSATLTLVRSFFVLLPLTLLLGLMDMEHFWLVFPLTETLSLGMTVLLVKGRGKGRVLVDVPVLSAALDNDNQGLADLLDSAENFCKANGAGAYQASLARMALEELCLVIIDKAFTGDEREYIQVTLIAEKDGRFTLHIRSRAERFNPFDMRMGKIRQGDEEDFLDSVGVMVIKKRAEKFYYRRNSIFNVLTVVI